MTPAVTGGPWLLILMAIPAMEAVQGNLGVCLSHGHFGLSALPVLLKGGDRMISRVEGGF